MPYIRKELKENYLRQIEHIENQLIQDKWNPGIITWIFYTIIRTWFLSKRRYQTIAEIRGVLSGIEDEFNRRFAHDYEDEKRIENGDA